MLIYVIKVQQMKIIKRLILILLLPTFLLSYREFYADNNLIVSNIVGHIKVNNTLIDYPILKYQDNSFYLDHDLYGNLNKAGSIFMDYRSNSDLTSKNTIIYGHARISDQTMFGSLYNILNASWYETPSNYIITITKDNINYYYEVFSTYVISKETYYLKVNFSDSPSYIDFLKTLKSRSYFNYPATVTENDLILTLSTCYKNNQRLVLHAKLIYNDI